MSWWNLLFVAYPIALPVKLWLVYRNRKHKGTPPDEETAPAEDAAPAQDTASSATDPAEQSPAIREPASENPKRAHSPLEDDLWFLRAKEHVLLLTAEDVDSSTFTALGSTGVYGWFFDNPPKEVPLDGCVQVGDRWLLYVGVAGDESSHTLRSRLRNHFNGNVAASTLRESLACLLAEELNLSLTREPSGHLVYRQDW